MGSQGRAPSGHLDVTRHWQTWHGLGLVMDTGTPGPWDDPAEHAPLGRGCSSISLSSQPLWCSAADLAVRGLRTQRQPQEHRLPQHSPAPAGRIPALEGGLDIKKQADRNTESPFHLVSTATAPLTLLCPQIKAAADGTD